MVIRLPEANMGKISGGKRTEYAFGGDLTDCDSVNIANKNLVLFCQDVTNLGGEGT